MVERGFRMTENHVITVTNRHQGDYPVIIGSRAIDQLRSLLPGDAKRSDCPRAAVGGYCRVAERYSGSREAGLLAELPDAEGAKRIEVVSFCWGVLGQTDFGRTDAIVSLGGGATSDVAGFVAATWLRGVPLVHIPTTVLGMVDAAIGGKTGINTAEGKNLVGSFLCPQSGNCRPGCVGECF